MPAPDCTLTARDMDFKPLTMADIPRIARILAHSTSRTCDYTIGGLYMWIEMFGYRHAVIDDTLFISGLSQSDMVTRAMSLPVGGLDTATAISLAVDRCVSRGIAPVFSAVPADRVIELTTLYPRCRVVPLTGWSDYLYDIDALATLTGKRYNKKRNHVNRFIADNPAYIIEPLTRDLIPETLMFMSGLRQEPGDPAAYTDPAYERRQCINVLRSYPVYGFEGAVLRDTTGTIAALTVAEVIGDTLFVHIEKANHNIAGAGETINKLFASMMLDKYPSLRYVNREEDVGDPGLRKAKLSYNPVALLDKYNVYL